MSWSIQDGKRKIGKRTKKNNRMQTPGKRQVARRGNGASESPSVSPLRSAVVGFSISVFRARVNANSMRATPGDPIGEQCSGVQKCRGCSIHSGLVQLGDTGCTAPPLPENRRDLAWRQNIHKKDIDQQGSGTREKERKKE